MRKAAIEIDAKLPDEYRDDAEQLGVLQSMILLKRWAELGQQHYCYRAEFENAVLVEHFAVDAANQIALMRGEDMVAKQGFRWKPRTGG